MPPDERRKAIIDAVIPLLVEHGAQVTTRQIAEAAGVAEGTLFRVFEDKVALLRAAAHSTMDPARGRRSLAAIDPDLDLEEMVRAVSTMMLENMGQVMAVLIAVRSVVTREHQHPEHGGGPPEFILESHRALLEGLTELFARYRAELRVEPERAALMLRGLVFGSRQPWMEQVLTLTADEIATVLVSGVATPNSIQNPAEKKPAEKKPAEKKPAEKKTMKTQKKGER
jgi:AcrR family transcriptional regulator